ncbi:MAG: class I tRNA ligase family protein [Candidatus Berkelbacteria bacterium]
MNNYDFGKIEKKWQQAWEKDGYGVAADDGKDKYYELVEFPYPSGAGLHVGHCMGYGASDIHARYLRLKGKNVMFPIGWDAFGLPTENYAIKNKIKPAVATASNIAVFKEQLKSFGYSFNWSREINTTDPAYYHWTQWIFLQFYKHAIIGDKLVDVADDDKTTPRLAYQAEMPVNWCKSCKIVLANEEIVNNRCERCGGETEKRKQKQWMLRITAYADRLIDDLSTVDYLQKIKTQQINWIGKSVGTNIKFHLSNTSDTIEVFTTRADTLFGCTYIVVAPESNYLATIKDRVSNIDEVERYCQAAKSKSDLERTELQKDKTGVELKGIKAINPINGEEVSVWVADYVLANYGTGAVMAVPAHDERDFEFANKYGIEIRQSILPILIDSINPPREGKENTTRIVAQCVIKHPTDDKYLTIKWNKFPWHNFVTGGIENGESIVDGAMREITAETGFKNVEFVRKMPIVINSHFYAAHKDVNRDIEMNVMEFRLKDLEKVERELESHEDFDVVWIKFEEMKDLKPLVELPFILRWLQDGDFAFTEYGRLANSGEFTGLSSEEGKKKITEKLKEIGAGDFTVNFKLRDWIFSRQHYWGEPIPIIHCDKCGTVPVAEDQLPIILPDIEKYEPTASGESPLAAISDWVNTTCPKCSEAAKRETDTMPNWAGSSWYYLAYAMNNESRIKNNGSNNNIFNDSKEQLKHWLPVDLYNGGPEHITLHLLYSRFWHKFLFDLGAVPTAEPYQKRILHGIILGADGQKMSKSKGNTINPDEMVKQFGADTLRAYVAFIGPYDQENAWSTAGIQGVHRFLKKVWVNQSLLQDTSDDITLLTKLNQVIMSVTDDIDNFRLNTVISKLMEMNNMIEKTGKISAASYKKYLTLLFPACPHLASELWELSKFDGNIIDQTWPEVDKDFLFAEMAEIVIQINGKIRDRLQVKSSISDDELKQMALDSTRIKELVGDKKIIKTIIVPKKLVNIVIEA